MESSLLEAELTAQQLGLEELRDEVNRLRARESLLANRLTAWRQQASQEMTEARQRLEAVEASLDLLDTEDVVSEDTDKELERLERIKQSHERLEAERRQFEDLEFRHMEQESVLEADRDEVLRELEAAERNVEEAEAEVREMERQAHEVSSGGQEESRGMRDRREEVGRQLRSQQEKLSQLEAKLSKLLVVVGRGERGESDEEDDDSGTITLSDEETLGPKVLAHLVPVQYRAFSLYIGTVPESLPVVDMKIM
jgi:chromosome segregation ATPase